MRGKIRETRAVRRRIAVDIGRESDEGRFAGAPEQLRLRLQQLRLDRIGLEAVAYPIDREHHPPLVVGQGDLRRGDRRALAAERQRNRRSPEYVALGLAVAKKGIGRADQLPVVRLPEVI